MRGSGCSGTAARSALRSSARGRPRLARHGTARLGSARSGQPSLASPGPPRASAAGATLEPPAPQRRRAASWRGGRRPPGCGGERGRRAGGDTAQHGTVRRELAARRALVAAAPKLRGWVSPDPPQDNYFGSFYPSPPFPAAPAGLGAARPGGVGAHRPPGTLRPRLLLPDF